VPLLNRWFAYFFTVRHKSLERTVFGLRFLNPVGLAAGFDKDGKYYRLMANLGFGFIEIGTVTPKAQPGNALPRLFRLPLDESLINRMGFNNEGVAALVNRLKKGKRPEGLIIGGNIGKNKTTPNAEAKHDYAYCFEALYPYVDYFVVNVSSPNTPNLRELQNEAALSDLLLHLQVLNRQKDVPKPLLLKIAPDLSEAQLDSIVTIAKQTQIAGFVATNTTISRANLCTDKVSVHNMGKGGLSGKVLDKRSTEIVRYLHQKTQGKLVIIAVGGINDAQSAIEKIKAGASLVQIYTGLIYEGPSLVKEINKAILQM